MQVLLYFFAVTAPLIAGKLMILKFSTRSLFKIYLIEKHDFVWTAKRLSLVMTDLAHGLNIIAWLRCFRVFDHGTYIASFSLHNSYMLSDSTPWFVRLSVFPSVGRSFTLWSHCSCPNGLVASNMAPAHLHAIGIAEYPAFFCHILFDYEFSILSFFQPDRRRLRNLDMILRTIWRCTTMASRKTSHAGR